MVKADYILYYYGIRYEIQANEESLLIRNVAARDEGTYECVAENVAGSVRAFATLTVFGKLISMESNFSEQRPGLVFIKIPILRISLFFEFSVLGLV